MAQAVQRGLVANSPHAPFRTVVTSAFCKRCVHFANPRSIADLLSGLAVWGGLGELEAHCLISERSEPGPGASIARELWHKQLDTMLLRSPPVKGV